MLGARRVPLLTVADKDKDEILVLPTIRFNIKLELPIESVSSEVSFIDLNDGKNGEKQSPEDPFGREDSEEMEQLKKIADKFNSKYGGSAKKSKKRKRNIKDLVDRGEGYCEDSFVDNSEAYDEVVPWCLDTKHGGFYINEGILDFIKNDDSDQEDQPKKKKEKFEDNQDGMKKKSKVGDQKKPKLKKKIKSDAEGLPKSENDSKQTPGTHPFAPVLVSKSEKLLPLVVEDVDQSMVVEEEVSELEESFTVEEPNEDPTVAQLITELSCEVIQKVALARAAQPPAMAGDNQVPHIFNSSLLESLTRLHSLCQTRKTEDKHSVFERVASACNCQKEQLYKKIKRHRMNLLNDEMNKKKEELKDAVARVMPALVEKYKHDLEESNKLKKESMMMTTKEVHGSGDSEADEEGKTEAEKGEKTKRIMAPRRKFVWSTEIRTLLCEVVSLKMRHFDMAKIKSQTAEEHLKSFLDSSIRPLWPSGWIQPRALFKESKPAHMSWTGDQNKTKKAVVTTQVTQATHQKIPITQQPQVQSQQQHQPVVVHKPINSTPNPPKLVEDPIVINLDESDNEQSKMPLTPVNKHNNKNVFTLLKEKQSSEHTKFEAKVHEAGHEGPADTHQVAVMQKAHDIREHKNEHKIHEAVSGINHSAIPMTQASQVHHQAKDLHLPQKNSLTNQDTHSRFSGTAPMLATEGKELVKQEHVFQGRFVSNSKPFQSPNIPNQTGGNKVKPLPIAEDGNIFVGYQTEQVDLTEESPQTPRKRTVSQVTLMHSRNTDSVNQQAIVQSSDSTHNTSLATSKPQTENSPKQPLQRAVFDSCAQNQTQKNANRDGNAYHPQQPQPSSQLYQQQLLQQQYQQFQQQQRQQQMVKKSPKQDKFPSPKQPVPNVAHANYSLTQQQPSNVGSSPMANVKMVQQSSVAKSNEIFVQDHQDSARVRANEVSGIQRGFSSGTPFSSTETKMNSFQKSPLKKVDSTTTQQQGFAAFQNLSAQSKQHLQQMIQQSQNIQQSIKSQQLAAPVPQSKQQIPSAQQMHNNQQQFSQQFFRAQNFGQEGSSQQKN